MERNNMMTIHQGAEVERIRRLADRVLISPTELDDGWVLEQGWIVIPVESSMGAKEREWLASACHKHGYDYFYALVTETEPVYEGTLRVDANTDGIHRAFSNCSPNHFIFVPEDAGFIYLRPYGLYALVAGPKTFVEAAVGSSEAAAREEFLDFADDELWPEADRCFLTTLADHYAKLCPSTLTNKGVGKS